jgi:competence protein ComEC
VAPKVVLFAVGHRNRYGFPDPAVVRRYREAGAKTYRSDRSGALQLTLGEGKLIPRAWRLEHRKIWHM